MKKGKFKYYAASDMKMAISRIYIYPDFRRKAQIPDLAVVRLSAESITADLNGKYLIFTIEGESLILESKDQFDKYIKENSCKIIKH